MQPSPLSSLCQLPVAGGSDTAAGVQSQTSLELRHENTQYAFAFKNLDWDAYHRFRPVYPPSMWSMWLDHHQRLGNGRFDTAHDLGSGPGTASAVLGDYFRKVYVSDAGCANLATAQATLAAQGRFIFHQSPAEQTAAWIPAESVDFSCICMAFHYMDSEATVRAVAETLKPGGTLAAVTYGFRLLFPGQPRAQELWYSVCSRATLGLMRDKKLFPAAVRGLAKAMTGLDFVAFPSDLFESVRRVYINVDPSDKRPFYFVDSSPELWEEAATHVEHTDSQEYVRDTTWGRLADMAWLQGFLASSQMGFGETTWALEEWRELQSIVGGCPNGSILIEWPVSITMATKKSA